MIIDKAIKKQKKSKIFFFITMMLLSFVLPIILYMSEIRSRFIVVYLIILELLIYISIINRLNFYSLKFSCQNNRLRIKGGILSKESLLICDKIAIIHTTKYKDDVEIVIVSTKKFKNKMLRPITKSFLQKYPEVNHEYLKLKKISPEELFYFQVIKRGGLNKYILLDEIYRNCVKAVYTSSAIDNIKIARNQKEF